MGLLPAALGSDPPDPLVPSVLRLINPRKLVVRDDLLVAVVADVAVVAVVAPDARPTSFSTSVSISLLVATSKRTPALRSEGNAHASNAPPRTDASGNARHAPTRASSSSTRWIEGPGGQQTRR